MSNCSVQDNVECLAVSHDGRWVMSASDDGRIRFRNAKTWKVQLVLQSYSNDRKVHYSRQPNHSEADVSTASVYSVDYNPCGGILATGASDSMVRICEFSPGYSRLRLIGARSREVLCYSLISVKSPITETTLAL